MPPKPGTCIICGKIFSQSQHVKAHMLTHTNERPFKCSICVSSHRTKDDLDKHIRYVHGSEKRPERKKQQCIFCEKILSHSGLFRHLRSHVREKPLSCSICGKHFGEISGLNRHLQSHSKMQGAPCVFCGKTFAIQVSCGDHIRSHINEKPYFCQRCPASFSSSGSFRYHTQFFHTTERKYPCQMCQKSFRHPDTRDSHIRSHLNEKPYQCNECGKRLSRSTALKNHSYLHRKTKPFPCQKCEKSFVYLNQLQRHEMDEHVMSECVFCHVELSTKAMMNHLKSHIHEKLYSCHICDESFKTSVARICHMRVHAEVRNTSVNCVFCEKVFPNKNRLELHIMSHVLEKPFDCTKCPKSFSFLTKLVRHVRCVHDRVRPFPCEICGRLFESRQSKEQHLNTHLNEKAHKCDECGKRFSTRNSLKCHLKTHLGAARPLFPCQICNTYYTSQKYLKLHGKKFHSFSFTS